MNNVERIKAELKRIMEACHDEDGNPITYGEDCAYARLSELDAFINALPSEPTCDDLEEEIERYMDQNYYVDEDGRVCDRKHDIFDFTDFNFKLVARHFANWQQQKNINLCSDWYDRGYKRGEANTIRMACNWLSNKNVSQISIDSFKKDMEG